MGYELTLLIKNNISNSFVDIQSKAESILENFIPKENKIIKETKQEIKQPIIIKTTELKLPKYLQEKLIDIPESGMGYQDVHLVLYDNTIINAPVVNGSILKVPPGKNIKIEDIKDII